MIISIFEFLLLLQIFFCLLYFTVFCIVSSICVVFCVHFSFFSATDGNKFLFSVKLTGLDVSDFNATLDGQPYNNEVAMIVTTLYNVKKCWSSDLKVNGE